MIDHRNAAFFKKRIKFLFLNQPQQPWTISIITKATLIDVELIIR